MKRLSRIASLTFLALFITLLSAVSVAQTDEPYIYILGVAQDAGYPQIGCYAQHCLPGWDDPALRRGATSIAVIDPRLEKNFCSRLHRIFRNSYTC